MLTFGYKASAEQFAPRDLLDFAVHAEAVGFQQVMISDHFQPWKHEGGHAPFSLAWLGALGERTSHITIGTSVVTPTFRYHPSIVAHAVATLDVLFPGRLLLGVGTGESLNDVPATGMNWPPFKERIGRLREAIELIQRLWREDRVTFKGKYYQTEKATLYDRPETPVPLYVAASGPSAAKLAGEVADGFICTSGKPKELYEETLLPKVAEGIEKAGRAPGDIDYMIEMKVSFDTDRQRALEDTRHWAALALSQEEKMGVDDPAEMQRLADALPIERAASRWIVSSDPSEHVEKLSETIDLGFTQLVFHAPGTDQRRFLDLYAQHILPRLRECYPLKSSSG